MKNQTIVKRINKMFPPSNQKYPVAFIRTDENHVTVTGECCSPVTVMGDTYDMPVISYYEMGGMWINPKLVKFLDSIGMFAEWENAACVGIWEV